MNKKYSLLLALALGSISITAPTHSLSDPTQRALVAGTATVGALVAGLDAYQSHNLRLTSAANRLGLVLEQSFGGFLVGGATALVAVITYNAAKSALR